MLGGTSSLEFKYLFSPTASNEAALLSGSIILPAAGGLPGLGSISLGLKTSETMTAVVGVRETGGGAYMAPFFAPAGAWQQVVLGMDDFYPVEGMADADGKLDPGQWEGLGVIDASGLLAGLLGKLPVSGFEPGARTIWLDDVMLLTSAPEPDAVPHPVERPAPAVIDACDRDTIRWIVVGGKQWTATCEPNPGGAGGGHYRFEYTLPGGTLVAWLKPVREGHLAGTQALHLSVRADRALRLMVNVEEKGKARYAKTVEVAAGEDWTRLSLPWTEFTREGEAEDESGKLEPEQITLISLADPSGLLGGPQDHPTVLGLDEVYASP